MDHRRHSLAAAITAAGQADNVAASALYTNRTGTETANAASIGGTGAGREQPDPQQSETKESALRRCGGRDALPPESVSACG